MDDKESYPSKRYPTVEEYRKVRNGYYSARESPLKEWWLNSTPEEKAAAKWKGWT